MHKPHRSLLLFLLVSLSLTSSCIDSPVQPAAEQVTVLPHSNLSFAKGGTTEHLAMGNPSGATTSTSNYTNYLMSKTQYVLSYHRDKGTPNWTAWHLDNTWLGSAARQDDFRADATLPSGWYQVNGSSYSGSGYDRGHMCPSADRTYSVTDNSATFLMTNMVPQAPNNNQGPWAKFEDYCRSLVSQGYEVYIYSGGYGSLGTINSGHVNVPARTWKVAMVLTNGTGDVARVTTSTRLIAVDMTNTNSAISKSADWKTFRVSVDYVESKTGYNFFSAVSSTIQAAIESKVDNL
jgi:endonuclease G